MRTLATVSLMLLLITAAASAQTLSLGTNFSGPPNSSDSNAGPTRTDCPQSLATCEKK